MIRYLKTAQVKNKTVLVRGSVDASPDDDFRLQSFLPTLEFLLANNNKVIICGKRGRAKGQVVESLSLKPAAGRLAQLLSAPIVFFPDDFRTDESRGKVNSLLAHGPVFLENLEFYPEELQNDPDFAKQLAALAEVYVNDDFSKCHHLVASNGAVTEYLPSYAGLLLEKELSFLSAVLKNVKHPFVLMTGGIKLSEKVDTLKNLGKQADKLLVGGGVANLLFLAKGFEIGSSKLEEGELKTAWEIEKNFKDKLLLPMDLVVANEAMDPKSIRVREPYQVKKGELILDIGPKTILAFARELKQAQTIVWSGPLGVFEKKPFATGTLALAQLIGGLGKGQAFVVAGGGDTVDAIRRAHQLEHFDHVSTGGGAMLEFLAGNILPGIAALDK